MKELLIRLEDEVALAFADGAHQIGLSSEELAKYVLGQQARMMVPPIGTAMNPAPGQLEAIAGRAEEMGRKAMEKLMGDGGLFSEGMQAANNAARLMAERLIDSGELKCPFCTQPLTRGALARAECTLCGQSIFPADKPAADNASPELGGTTQ